MILKIRNGMVENEIGQIVAVLTDTGNNPEIERVIELGSEAIPKVEEFIEKVNSGKFHPRKTVAEFEQLLNKHPVQPNI